MRTTPTLGLLFLFSFSLTTRSFAVSPDASQSAANLPAQRSLTLLISLDPKAYPKGLQALFHNYSKYPEKLEKTFRTEFANSNYRIQVINNANVYDLYQSLHDSSNIGVFWVSHTAAERIKANSIAEVLPPIFDYRLADVRDAFRNPDPAIRWVGIVGCDSNFAISWLNSGESASDSSDHSSLRGFNTEIDANAGLKKSIAQATLQFAIDGSQAQAGSTIATTPIVIRRALRGDPAKETFFPPVLALLGEERTPVSAFQAVRLHPTQNLIEEETALVPVSLTNWDLLFESGFSVSSLPTGFQMGDFTVISSRNNAHWSAFSIGGAPLGVTSFLFEYDGRAPL